jgi:hypothetical protein
MPTADLRASYIDLQSGGRLERDSGGWRYLTTMAISGGILLCIDRWRPGGYLPWIAPNFPPSPSRSPFLLHSLIVSLICSEVHPDCNTPRPSPHPGHTLAHDLHIMTNYNRFTPYCTPKQVCEGWEDERHVRKPRRAPRQCWRRPWEMTTLAPLPLPPFRAFLLPPLLMVQVPHPRCCASRFC